MRLTFESFSWPLPLAGLPWLLLWKWSNAPCVLEIARLSPSASIKNIYRKQNCLQECAYRNIVWLYDMLFILHAIFSLEPSKLDQRRRSNKSKRWCNCGVTIHLPAVGLLNRLNHRPSRMSWLSCTAGDDMRWHDRMPRTLTISIIQRGPWFMRWFWTFDFFTCFDAPTNWNPRRIRAITGTETMPPRSLRITWPLPGT